MTLKRDTVGVLSVVIPAAGYSVRLSRGLSFNLGSGSSFADIKKSGISDFDIENGQIQFYRGIVLKSMILYRGRPLLFHILSNLEAHANLIRKVFIGVNSLSGLAGLSRLFSNFSLDIEMVLCYGTKGLGDTISSLVRTRVGDAGEQDTLIYLGDYAFISPLDIERLFSLYARVSSGSSRFIIHTRHRKLRGQPVIFSDSFSAQLGHLSGDDGARSILAKNSDACHFIDCEQNGVVMDLDRMLNLGT